MATHNSQLRLKT